jgi:hypothetical protein
MLPPESFIAMTTPVLVRLTAGEIVPVIVMGWAPEYELASVFSVIV